MKFSNVYKIKIKVTSTVLCKITVFSNDLEDDIIEDYYEQFKDLQANKFKYSIELIGRFNIKSPYFDLACDAMQYVEEYS